MWPLEGVSASAVWPQSLASSAEEGSGEKQPVCFQNAVGLCGCVHNRHSAQPDGEGGF